MAVNLAPAGNLLPVPGIELAATSAGIYPRQRPDVALLRFAGESTVSAVFTRNDFAAAPVILARRHARSRPRFCLINAGNANAGTGTRGVERALAVCGCLAELADCEPDAVLPFSTGIIGVELPEEKINRALPVLLEKLAPGGWADCAAAIVTTDTVTKGLSVQVELDGTPVTVTGIAKGSGMIRPDMATMLAFVGTDAAVDRPVLDGMLRRAVALSFNRICVDGDMSTNDACLLIASGRAAHRRITSADGDNFARLQEALNKVCTHLASAVVRDGEGATKFITVIVDGGREADECLKVAYAVATSPLVKTAMFASDANWGRILAATGRAGIDGLDVSRVSISLNDCRIVQDGMRAPDYTEEAGTRAMAPAEIMLHIDLGRGNASETVWTCDLSHEYVRINAEYRS